MKGMGLLAMDTVFEEAKTRTRVTGTFGSVGASCRISAALSLRAMRSHMGVSTLKAGAQPMTDIEDFVERDGVKRTVRMRKCIRNVCTRGV